MTNMGGGGSCRDLGSAKQDTPGVSLLHCSNPFSGQMLSISSYTVTGKTDGFSLKKKAWETTHGDLTQISYCRYQCPTSSVGQPAKTPTQD